MKPAETISLPSWLQSPATQTLLSCIPNTPETIRFVGGCIRDTLLGLSVKDIDIATLYSPQEILTFIEKKGFKVVPIGIEHGSVLAVINSQCFEITTLRKDIKTFGRHAKVSFTDDWLEDAKRRDFTINALYLSPQGELYDPWKGQEDLKRGFIKFIGAPEQRVQEDYLRILRFFRFLAHFGNETIDQSSYDACKKFSSFLKLLSVERIHAEFLKLCSAVTPAFAIQKMYEAEVLDILFPTSKMFNNKLLSRLIQLEKKYPNLIFPNPLRRFYLLCIALSLHPLKEQDRFRFSKQEKNYLKLLNTLLNHRSLTDAILLYRYPPNFVLDCRLIEAVLTNEDSKLDAFLSFLETWQNPLFPLKGEDLLKLGIPTSPQIGKYLYEIEEWWVKKNFLPTHFECLEEVIHRLKIPLR